jgi:hypothetical protein
MLKECVGRSWLRRWIYRLFIHPASLLSDPHLIRSPLCQISGLRLPTDATSPVAFQFQQLWFLTGRGRYFVRVVRFNRKASVVARGSGGVKCGSSGKS